MVTLTSAEGTLPREETRALETIGIPVLAS
jgi:hypothetical protein